MHAMINDDIFKFTKNILMQFNVAMMHFKRLNLKKKHKYWEILSIDLKVILKHHVQ